MAKLPENFGMEEKVVHPYRTLVITIAVIIGVSLFAGGMFYRGSVTQNGDTATSNTEDDETSKSAKVEPPKQLDEVAKQNLYEEAKVNTKVNSQPTLSQDQIDALNANAKAIKGPAQLTPEQIKALNK